MDSHRLHIVIRVILRWVIGTLITFPQVMSANPTGGEVVGGNATIDVNPDNPQHQIITQTTSKAIINWNNFSNSVGERIQFVQPSPSAIVLNRVTGAEPSVILGRIDANGHVWVLNPAGVLFGRTATVDVAGLFVTTANISNQSFMSGDYHFLETSGRSASVINQGHIKVKDSGIAALVAPGVQNSGVIEANLGKVVLASGTEYTVDFYGDNLIHFAMSQPPLLHPVVDREGRPVKDAVVNSGQLIANGGKILLTAHGAGQVVENLINMQGVTRANTVVEKAGKIILQGVGEGVVKVTGKIEAQGKKGGEIVITGKRTGLFERAEINVSGEEAGGKVLVGGDFQGRNRERFPWAEATFMGKDARIRADALGKGDGGTVVLWSEHCTRFYGDVSARGGREGGNGGLIETSGHWLDPLGKINASAPKGLPGEWLLDPYDIVIGDVLNSNGSFSQTPPGTQLWTATNTPSRIGNNVIRNYLNNNFNVWIRTAGAGVNQGNITVNGFISKSSGVPVTLTLEADNHILINESIFNTAGMNLTLTLITPGTVFGVGDIDVAALQLNVGTGFTIGNPPTATTSYVAGNDTGSNIQLLNTFGPGTHLFNGNDLYQYLPPPPPPPPPPPVPPTPPADTSPPATVVNSALDPSNFVLNSVDVPQADTQSSVIETQTAPVSSTSSSSFAPESSGSTPLPAAAPLPESASGEAPPPAPATSPPEAPFSSGAESAPILGSEAVAPSPALSSYGSEEVSSPSNFIGGGSESQEPIQTAEAAGGKEGLAEGSFEPEAMEKTEEVFTPCPVNIEENNKPVPPNCPEEKLKGSAPVSSDSLTNTDVGPDSQIAQELNQKPLGPEGVLGIDVPIGAAGIGGGSFDQERVETAEGAEGNESLMPKYNWSPQEEVDRSSEYKDLVLDSQGRSMVPQRVWENLGSEPSKPLSFWIRQTFVARLNRNIREERT